MAMLQPIRRDLLMQIVLLASTVMLTATMPLILLLRLITLTATLLQKAVPLQLMMLCADFQ